MRSFLKNCGFDSVYLKKFLTENISSYAFTDVIATLPLVTGRYKLLLFIFKLLGKREAAG